MYRLIFTFIIAGACTLPTGVMADINCAADAAGCCCRGTRGNVDCDYQDIVDINDVTLLVDYLFFGLPSLPSVDEANVDGEDGIDIADLSVLVDGLYVSYRPFPNCSGPTNHPPVTTLWLRPRVWSFWLPPDSLYINAVTPGHSETGVSLHWNSNDRLDHPYEPPSLRYEWRVYGPYDSATYADLKRLFARRVFVTPLGKVYYIGNHLSLSVCDTTWTANTPPTQVVNCRTLLIDTVTASNKYGIVDTIFDAGSPVFAQDARYNRLAVWSGTPSDRTVADTSVTLYDLYRNDPNDTTVEKYFIFWVRTRDADDSSLFDPTPPFVSFRMIDPKFERDVIVVDAEISYQINGRNKTAALAYWNSAIPSWNPGATYDFTSISQSAGNVLTLKSLLQHKVAIILNDDVTSSLLRLDYLLSRLHTAMLAGVGVWLCGRNMFYGAEGQTPISDFPFSGYGGIEFGVARGHWSGWLWYLYQSSTRIEDFSGALSVNSSRWPNLVMDTSYLHARYLWDPDLAPWMPMLAALPEVNYFTPVPEAEALYTYQSIYTDHHPLLADSFFCAGQPVVFRLNGGSYRVLASAFTPYAFADDGMSTSPLQIYVDSVLNWLYSPFTQAAIAPNLGTQHRNSREGRAGPAILLPSVVGVKEEER